MGSIDLNCSHLLIRTFVLLRLSGCRLEDPTSKTTSVLHKTDMLEIEIKSHFPIPRGEVRDTWDNGHVSPTYQLFFSNKSVST